MKDNPFKDVVAELDGQMKRRANEAIDGQWAAHELGTIEAGGLRLDNFTKDVIPINRCLIARDLTLKIPYFTDTKVESGGSGDAEYAPHSHPVITPPELWPVKVGDRVLVAPVGGGQNFVIEQVVVPWTGPK